MWWIPLQIHSSILLYQHPSFTTAIYIEKDSGVSYLLREQMPILSVRNGQPLDPRGFILLFPELWVKRNSFGVPLKRRFLRQQVSGWVSERDRNRNGRRGRNGNYLQGLVEPPAGLPRNSGGEIWKQNMARSMELCLRRRGTKEYSHTNLPRVGDSSCP
jgi:hypothetical protein